MPELIAALIIALVGFGGGWQIQSWRYDAKEKARVEQILADQRLSAARDLRRSDTVITAQNESVARLAVLRNDAAGSRAALISLSVATETAVRAATASHDACTSRAATFSQLLNQCGAAYQELGERADRHTSDIKTLIQAWPK